MSKIKYTLVKAPFEKLEGKYTAQVVSNGTAGKDEINERAAKDHLNISPETMTNIQAAYATVLGEYIREGKTVQTPFGNVRLRITGSLPSMDGALTGADNQFAISFEETPSFNRELDKIKPYLDVEAIGGISITDVEDALSHAKGEIRGTTEFIVTGHLLSATGTGEGLTLVDPDGVLRATVTIVGEYEAQRIHARLATAVTPGTYRLRLVTHGYGTPDANLVTLAKKVTVK